jgi:hypothetical protein
LIGSDISAGYSDPSPINWYFGTFRQGTDRWWNGKMGETYFFNTSLTPNEVKELYNLSKLKYTTPTKLSLTGSLRSGLKLWITGDGSGSIFYDVSGNANDGTGKNSPIVTGTGMYRQIETSNTLNNGVVGNLTITGSQGFTYAGWFQGKSIPNATNYTKVFELSTGISGNALFGLSYDHVDPAFRQGFSVLSSS